MSRAKKLCESIDSAVNGNPEVFKCEDCGFKGSESEFTNENPSERYSGMVCPDCGGSDIELIS